MRPYFRLLLLLAVSTATANKYVYKRNELNWFAAQKSCRTSHTDLASIDNLYDISLIQKLQPDVGPYSWIGLMNTTVSSSGWMWSGGGEMSWEKRFWAPGEPNDCCKAEDYGAIMNSIPYHLWVDASASMNLAFLCYHVHAVREMMTWYEALNYCRQRHQDLASVASETEMMQIKTELSKELSTANVWIGLGFLSSEWLWMDGQPFSYESWGPDPKPICPDINDACGAIRVHGQTQQVGEKALTTVDGVLGWNVLNCYERLHFLCY